MTNTKIEIEFNGGMVEIEIMREELPDDAAQPAGLEHPHLFRAEEIDQARLNAWKADDWSYIGVRAVATIRDTKTRIAIKVSSAGLWAIESDAGDQFLSEVYAEELESIRPVLARLGLSDAQIESAKERGDQFA